MWNKIKTIETTFFITDIYSAYHQVKLKEDTRNLLVFRLDGHANHVYKRAPMGFSTSGDYMVQSTDTMLAGLKGLTKKLTTVSSKQTWKKRSKRNWWIS